jgi:radical SAM protein with 4Fe4S-binding SPASM domain
MNITLSPSPAEVVKDLRWRPDLGLLFNPRTGVFTRADTDTATMMIDHAKQGRTAAEITALVAAAYGVDPQEVAADVDDLFAQITRGADTDDQQPFLGVDKRFDQPLTFPLRLEIEVTAVCNWNCGFCYNVWKIDPSLSDTAVRKHIRELPTKHIPVPTVHRVLDECAAKGCFIVRYSGGETLLHPDALEIFDYGGALGLYQVVFTNGHFVNEQVAARMAAANVRCALVSLHGDRDTHNRLAGHPRAYDRAIAAMRILTDAGIDVVAETTLVRDNASGILDIIRDVYPLGVRQVGVMRYVPTGKNDEQYAVPQQLMLPLMADIDRLVATECPGVKVGWPCGQKFCTTSEDTPLLADDPTMALRFSQLTGHCESGLVWGSVSFDGQLRNCPHSNVYFGDVRDGIETSWQTLTAKVAQAVAPRATCTGCEVAGICRGGCHLSSFLAKPGGLTLLPAPTVRAA